MYAIVEEIDWLFDPAVDLWSTRQLILDFYFSVYFLVDKSAILVHYTVDVFDHIEKDMIGILYIFDLPNTSIVLLYIIQTIYKFHKTSIIILSDQRVQIVLRFDHFL